MTRGARRGRRERDAGLPRESGAAAALSTLSPFHPLSILTQVKSTRGKVISAGKGTTLSTGAAVTYSKYAGTEVTLADGKELVILKEEDVIGILGGGPEEWGKLQPLGDRVLLQALEAAKETAGGVILASEEVERPTLGKVRVEKRGNGWEGRGARLDHQKKRKEKRAACFLGSDDTSREHPFLRRAREPGR